MHIQTFSATNFKGLENVQVRFEVGVNLIVGPNGVGKTTILDAIRFVKSLLAPRTQQETFQTLLSLGATSHANRNEMFLNALAGDQSKNVEVHYEVSLSPQEITSLTGAINQIAQEFLRKQMNLSGDLNAWISYISNFQGIAMLKRSVEEISNAVKMVEKYPTFRE